MSFQTVVFGGGGSRCMWQAGFWRETDLRPQRIVAVSAGAAIACMIMAGRAEVTLSYFMDLTERNARNAYPSHFLSDQPVFPHAKMYRDTLLAMLDNKAWNELQSGPDIQVLVARPPQWSPVSLAAVVGFVAYGVERRVLGRLHPSWWRRLGFRAELVSIRSCTDPEQLADLVLASSCTPPITPFLSWDGQPALDGGVVDPAPATLVDDGEATLVLLSRQHPADSLPRSDTRTYVQPSAPIDISIWDYTNPRGLKTAYDLGRADGAAFAATADARPDS